jgi:hypothetical protein
MIDQYDDDVDERPRRRRAYDERERFPEPVPRRGGCVIGSLIVAGALVVMGALIYLGLSRATDNINPFDNISNPLDNISNPLEPAPSKVTVTGPAIVEQIRGLNRLETSSATIRDVVTAEQARTNAVADFFLGDRLILIAQGEVIAGFDLAQLGPEDVIVSTDGVTATVTLPPAEILVSRLDNEKTQVYDRATGVFSQGDPNLESEARRVAERRMVELACESGILERAIADGERNIENLIKAVGPEVVIVNAEPGACPLPSPSPAASPSTSP